jgi:hypothetical protein
MALKRKKKRSLKKERRGSKDPHYNILQLRETPCSKKWPPIIVPDHVVLQFIHGLNQAFPEELEAVDFLENGLEGVDMERCEEMIPIFLDCKDRYGNLAPKQDLLSCGLLIMENSGRPGSLFESIRRPLEETSLVAGERRRHSRRASQIPVDYVADGRAHRSFILNISSGGVFIATPSASLWGQEILISFNHPVTRMNVFVVGRIARVDQSGIGVRFKRMADDDERCLLASYSGSGISAEKKGEGENMGRIRGKRIHWEPSASPEVVKYRLYWLEGSIVGYTSKYVDVGKVTEVILPDEVPSFPMMKGEVTFGIAAFNEAGNESDITEVTAHIDFVVPDAPANLMVEDV